MRLPDRPDVRRLAAPARSVAGGARWTVAALAALLAACATSPPAARITRYGDASTVYATGVTLAAGAPLYFTAGMTPGEGAQGPMQEQALATLRKLADHIAAAGLQPADLLFVRAYLAPGADGNVDYAGWNAAWTQTFGTASNPVKPARTTVAVPLLGRPGTLIELEFVCAGAAPGGSASAPALPAANPALTVHGTPASRIAAGVGIAAGAGTYFTAGTLAAIAQPDAPAASPERYGDMQTQGRSVLTRLQQNLAGVGLTFQDVVFLRAFVGADPLRGGGYDLAGWNSAYDAFFNTPANPHKPARATVTTPTYGGPGPVLEVELVTAFPGAPGDAVAFDARTPATLNPNLRAYGDAASPIASGIAVKPGSSLYFSAGAVPTVDGDLKTQALSALESLKARMAEAGLGFKDVVFLRAYVVPEADGSIDRKGWGEAYAASFNNPAQPQKPARTTIAVTSLPKPAWKIEIDVVAAQP